MRNWGRLSNLPKVTQLGSCTSCWLSAFEQTTTPVLVSVSSSLRWEWEPSPTLLGPWLVAVAGWLIWGPVLPLAETLVPFQEVLLPRGWHASHLFAAQAPAFWKAGCPASSFLPLGGTWFGEPNPKSWPSVGSTVPVLLPLPYLQNELWASLTRQSYLWSLSHIYEAKKFTHRTANTINLIH